MGCSGPPNEVARPSQNRPWSNRLQVGYCDYIIARRLDKGPGQEEVKMDNPISSLNELMAKLNAQSSSALDSVLSRHPEKRLPRWRPSRWKHWFHLHSWKRGLFDGSSFPESIGYQLESLPNQKWELRLFWECQGCPVVCITKDMVAIEEELLSPQAR